MNDGIRLVLALGLLVTSLAHADGKPATPSRGPRLEAVTFVIHHRVFHDFRDMQRVKLNQDFILGDTEFSARVVQYVPDFQMDLEHHRIFTLSDQPNNPAFKIVVRKGKAPQDTTWGFLKSPPHFGARSFFAFQVVRIDFVGRPPLLADTTATGRPAGGRPPAPAGRDSVRKP
jgi:hypothetical protein